MTRMYRSLGPVAAAILVMLAIAVPGALARQQSTTHPMVGHWAVSTNGESAGELSRQGIYTFRADGTILIVFQAKPGSNGTPELIWWGEGMWEAKGDNAARYSMSWATRDAAGTMTGTVTFDGVIAIQDDGSIFEDDRRQSLVTMRNRNGTLTASYGADASQMTAAVTGQRIEVGSD